MSFFNDEPQMTEIEILEYQIDKAFEHADRIENRLDVRIKELAAEVSTLRAEVRELREQNDIRATTGASEV